jgi:hypothetical protein
MRIRILRKNGKVLFSGSNKAFEIWQRGHHIPRSTTFRIYSESSKSSGLGRGRKLLPRIEVNEGKTLLVDHSLHYLSYGCHTSKCGNGI